MKKIVFLLVAVLGLITATQSQNPILMPLAAGDTLVNTTPVNKVFVATAGYSAVGIQVVVTKISGTVAGTITPQVSMDGTNYLTLPGATALTNTDVTTNTQVWSITGGVPWKYFRVRGVGSGTMSAVMRVYYTLRRFN